MNDGIQFFEFDTRIVGCKTQFDGGFVGVAFGFPGQGFAFQSYLIGDVTRQALTAENTEFDFRHIEPTAVFGDRMRLQSVQDTFGLGWGKHFIQGAPYGTGDIVGGIS